MSRIDEILKGLEELKNASTTSTVNDAAQRVKKLIDELAEEKESGVCVACQKERVFQKGKFDKCFSCARECRDKLHDEFVAILSPEQLAVFEKYDKARSDFSSMVILD